MECACAYVDAEDGPEFYQETKPTARIEHRCGECRRTIEPGEQYERVSGKWDGTMDTHKTCADCLSIRTHLFCGSWNFTMIHEDLYEHLRDACWGGRSVSHPTNDPLEKLTPAAREAVCEMIEDIWSEQEERE